jgi:succinate dehydrogenase / fumarate reductase iron-sulfur subunit
MAELQIQLKIFRNKQGQAAPGYQTFTALADEDTTVLVALQDIRRDQDPSLTFRHSCHHASCGTCGLKINGQEKLACDVNLLDLGTSTVLVEPLDNLPLVSDLVVDMGRFYERYAEPMMPYLRQSEFVAGDDLPEGVTQFQRFENCLECGLCVSACPIVGSDSDYLGPAAMAAAWRVVAEPRSSDPNFALSWVDDQHGCWRCHVAYECTEVCPSEVDPGGSIMALRKTLIKRNLRRLFGGAS